MILNNLKRVLQKAPFNNNKKQVKSYYIPRKSVFYPLSNDIINSNHTLIGGTTGSGKSVLLNLIICEFLKSYGVNNKLYLIDPKRVELSIYKNLPHVARYTCDPVETNKILDEVINIMGSRYAEMEKTGARLYSGSKIFIIIDELADLMINKSTCKEFSLKLQKILQLGRASKIHVISATQSPSRKIIPSELVLNYTNRVALRCLSPIESRQIINVSGAEKLPQYGKALYLSPKDGINLVNIPFISENDIYNIINQWFTTMIVK